MEVAPTLADAMDNDCASTPNRDIEIPSSPPLPCPRPLAFPFNVGRKRVREDYPPTSSDAPMFSSDDASTSAESYLQRRSKRQYQGPWWDIPTKNTTGKGLPRKKREFKRAVDSGVWMGSDETTESEEQRGDEVLQPSLQDPQRNKIRIGNKVHVGVVARNPLGKIPAFPRPPEQDQDLKETNDALIHAFQTIQHCVDMGLETIDLSSRRLTQLPSSILEPLHYLTKQKANDALPPSQEAYEPLTPSLWVFLSSNRLQSLPGEVYKLQNLSVLGLRQNQLTELAPAIGRLTNLQELNVSSNQLRWLPWEILALVGAKLKILSIHPNPFIQPYPIINHEISSYRAEIHRRHNLYNVNALFQEDKWKPRAMGTTKVSFLDISGVPFRGSALTPSVASHSVSPCARTLDYGRSNAKVEREQNFVPSLLELALRTSTKSQYFSELPLLLPEDIASRLSRLLQDAWQIHEAGGKQCSVCGQDYLIPRTEWIEWWDCVPASKNTFEFVPLIRRGCSWKCLPDFEVPPLSHIPLERRQCGWLSSS